MVICDAMLGFGFLLLQRALRRDTADAPAGSADGQWRFDLPAHSAHLITLGF
jgi:hypothetical protein